HLTGIECEGACAAVHRARKFREARIERRLVDAENACTEPLESPGPAAGTGAEIDAQFPRLRTLADQGKQFPQLEVGAAGRCAVFNEAGSPLGKGLEHDADASIMS